MANKKATERENLLAIRDILEVNEAVELMEYVDHKIELLDKRKAKKTETKPEDVEKMNRIVEILNGVEKATVTEIVNELADGTSNQKVTALLKKIDGVTQSKVGKSSFYSIA